MLSPWHEARLSALTSSDAAAILGYSIYRSPYAVQREKLRQTEVEDTGQAPSEDAWWGLVMEPIVLQTAADRLGARRIDPADWQRRMPHSEVRALWDGKAARPTVFLRDYPVMSTPDDLWELEGETVVVEAKTTSAVQLWSAGPPRQVWAQAQWHMLASGLSRCAVPCLFFGGSRVLTISSIDRDPRFAPGGPMATMAREWWTLHVEQRQPIRPNALDAEYIRDQHPAGDGRTVELDAGQAYLDARFVQARQRYEAAQTSFREAERDLKDVEVLLREQIGDASFARISGVPGVLYTLIGTPSGGRHLRRKEKK